jgi:hypothetical protein
MVSWWLISGLVLAAISVASLGAAFSVIGLAALFSGAALSVAAMAGSLEFAKFVLAAYLHSRWSHLNTLLKAYLTIAVMVLSLITSMGIFGYLSNAYQSASAVLDTETVHVNSLKSQIEQNKFELARLSHLIDEIPANRITKRLQVRAAQEPQIQVLNNKNSELEKQIAVSDLKIIEIKQKVGPLFYIARAFAMDLDTVVKYLILILVLVFDPLAISLVIATTNAIESRRKSPEKVTVAAPVTSEAPASPPPVAAPADPTKVIKMRFVEEKPSGSEA